MNEAPLIFLSLLHRLDCQTEIIMPCYTFKTLVFSILSRAAVESKDSWNAIPLEDLSFLARLAWQTTSIMLCCTFRTLFAFKNSLSNSKYHAMLYLNNTYLIITTQTGQPNWKYYASNCDFDLDLLVFDKKVWHKIKMSSKFEVSKIICFWMKSFV
jgi:hypothetical protein